MDMLRVTDRNLKLLEPNFNDSIHNLFVNLIFIVTFFNVAEVGQIFAGRFDGVLRQVKLMQFVDHMLV
jgi:hypothetical protein